MAWLRQLLDWQKETEDPSEFLESLRFDLSRNEVFVFTPKGDVIALPAGATPVDFAYAVHTEVGHRTIGARVNGRLVPLESTLDNGDLVEVFTSKAAGAGPSRDWLGFVKSPRARNKIRAWFSKERRDEAIEQGKDAIARAMRKQNLPIQRMLTGDSLVTLAHEMRYPDISVAVRGDRRGPCRRAERRAEAGAGARRRGGAPPRTSPRSRPVRARPRASAAANADPGVVVKGVERRLGQAGPLLHARCPATRSSASSPAAAAYRCTARTASTSSHCPGSPSGSSRSSGRPPSPRSSWSPSRSRRWTGPGCSRTSPASCPTSTSTSCPRPSRPPATGWPPRRFTFEMGDPKHLGHVLKAVRGVEGVYDVYRVTSARRP